MGFVGAALGFPAVVFTFALVVVIGYWVLVLLGGLGIDALDGEDGSDFLDGLGLGGVPAAVVLSLLIAVAWFVSLAGAVLLDRATCRAWCSRCSHRGASGRPALFLVCHPAGRTAAAAPGPAGAGRVPRATSSAGPA